VAILALGPAITAVGSIISGIIGVVGTIVGAFGGLATVVSAVTTAVSAVIAILGGPLTVALVAAGAAIAAYETNFLGFRDIVLGVFQSIEDAAAFLTGTGEGTLVGGVRSTLNGLAEYFNNTLDFSGLTEAFDSAIEPIQTAIDGLISDVESLSNTLNGLSVPDLEIPSISGGGGAGGGGEQVGGGPSIGPGGGIVGGDSSGVDPSVPSDSISRTRPSPLGAATGGLIESTGVATVHSGERVVPEAQITDRGQVEASGGMTIENLTVDANSRSEGRAAGKALKRELKRFDI
jgi:hypothetical protein